MVRKNEKRIEWSKAEEKTLIRGIEKFGCKPSKLETLFPNRSVKAIEGRI